MMQTVANTLRPPVTGAASKKTSKSTAKVAASLVAVAALGVAGCSSINWPTARSSTGYAGATPNDSTASIPAPTPVTTGVAAWDGDMSSPGLTAAHRSMPIGSWARVTNARTGQSAVVRITRRMTVDRGRDIELSREAATLIGALHEGVATVLIEPIDPRQAPPGQALWAPSAPASSAPAPIEVSRYEPLARPAPAPAPAPGYDPNIATSSIPTGPVGAAPRTQNFSTGATAAGSLAPRYVQLGSFRDQQNAHRMVRRLQSQGMTDGFYGDAFVETAYVGDTVFHRVRLGPIDGQTLAERALRDARALGHNGAQIVRP